MMRSLVTAGLLALLSAIPALADTVEVTGGMTSVALNSDLLASLGLSIGSLSDEVINPGSLPGSVAFPINPRDAAAPALPTTFTYDPADFLGTFAGTIEHSGVIFFDDGGETPVPVGNFTIGFDAGRVQGDASGFYVRSTFGLEGVLYDVGQPSTLDASASSLTVQAPLLVSPELSVVLVDNDSLAGTLAGEALIQAVPEPGSALMALFGVGSLLAYRRRRN